MTKCEDCRFAVETKYRTECRVNPPSFYGLAVLDNQCDPRGGVWPTVRPSDQCGRGEPKAAMPPNCDGRMVFDEASGQTCFVDNSGMLWPYTRVLRGDKAHWPIQMTTTPAGATDEAQETNNRRTTAGR